MRSTTRKLAALLAFLAAGAHAYTWPNPQLDALESLIYDQAGFNPKPIAGKLVPCSQFDFGTTPNRSNAADWIRTVRRRLLRRSVDAHS